MRILNQTEIEAISGNGPDDIISIFMVTSFSTVIGTYLVSFVSAEPHVLLLTGFSSCIMGLFMSSIA